MVNIPNDHFGPIPASADPRGTVGGSVLVFLVVGRGRGTLPHTIVGSGLAGAACLRWVLPLTPGCPPASSPRPPLSSQLPAVPATVPALACPIRLPLVWWLPISPALVPASTHPACTACLAGRACGRVLEGPSGLPAVGRSLPARGGHCGAVQCGGAVRGAVWRVRRLGRGEGGREGAGTEGGSVTKECMKSSTELGLVITCCWRRELDASQPAACQRTTPRLMAQLLSFCPAAGMRMIGTRVSGSCTPAAAGATCLATSAPTRSSPLTRWGGRGRRSGQARWVGGGASVGCTGAWRGDAHLSGVPLAALAPRRPTGSRRQASEPAT